MKNKCTLDPKVVVQSSELDIARQTIKEALMRLQQMQKRLSVDNNGEINEIAKYGQKNNGGFMTMSSAVHEVNSNIFGNIPNSSVVPTLPSTGTLMAMGTLWVGYYSVLPHTRVCKKSLYPSPYPRGQQL
jgi:hypothetical protein